MDYAVHLTQNEKRTICAVFGELLRKPYNELNTFLGSLTIEEMQKLYSKLHYEDYCIRHEIRYEDMTEADFEQEWHERNDYEYDEE